MPRRSKNEDDAAVGVMEKSNLTEEQRRQIRRQQRDLYKALEEQDQPEVEDARNKNNEIYKSVRYTREAVLDGENLTLIASKAAQRVERMIQVCTILCRLGYNNILYAVETSVT
jgi:arsenate reductase-like glutaredoxin family protein